MELRIYGEGWRSELTEDILKRAGIQVERTKKLSEGLILVCSLLPGKGEEIKDFIKNGGKVIIVYPERELIPIFGNELFYNYSFPMLRNLREEFPFSYLQIFSPLTLIHPKEGEVWANFAIDFATTEGSQTTRYPAVMWRELGKGKVGIFLYDFLSTILLFQQGYEFFSSTGDFPQPVKDGKFRAGYLFYKLLNPFLAHFPQAYLHELLFLFLMRKIGEDYSPIPRIWYYPYPATTCLILSGDSDSLGKIKLKEAWEKISFLKVPYTQFIMKKDLEEFSSQELKDWRKNGIDFGVHYYCGDMPIEKEMGECLEKEKEIFLKKCVSFDWARGHSLIWIGWDEQIKIMEEKGIRVDSNLGFCSGGILQGFPYYLYTKRGRSSIYELSICFSDDGVLHDKSGKSPLTVREALAKNIEILEIMKNVYYQPVNPVFHPHYFIGAGTPDTTEWLEGIIHYARKKNIPIMNFKSFFSWWERRNKCSLKYKIEKDNVLVSVYPEEEEIGVAFPEAWNGKKFQGEGVKLQGSREILIPVKRKKVVKYG